MYVFVSLYNGKFKQIECKKIQDMKKQQQSSTNTDTITDNRS